MMKRKCPECEIYWYSANSQAEYWICPKCGTKIGIELQEAVKSDEPDKPDKT